MERLAVSISLMLKVNNFFSLCLEFGIHIPICCILQFSIKFRVFREFEFFAAFGGITKNRKSSCKY